MIDFKIISLQSFQWHTHVNVLKTKEIKCIVTDLSKNSINNLDICNFLAKCTNNDMGQM